MVLKKARAPVSAFRVTAHCKVAQPWPLRSVRLLRIRSKISVGLVLGHALVFVRSLASRDPVRPHLRFAWNERHVRRLVTKLKSPLDHHALEHVVEPPDVAENPAPRIRFSGRLRPPPTSGLARADLVVDSVLEGVVTGIGDFQQVPHR